MPGAHDEKLIAEKYAIDYPRRPLATRLWKRRWNWLALLLACLVGGALYFVQGSAAFWSAPVSHVHASFAMDCQKCHTESWQPALRLASLDSGRHSVPNAACLECHSTAGDHHPRIGEQEPACAACHQEHRPAVPLLAVADNHCASCHGNLKSVPNAEVHFAAEIASFDAGPKGHPEFALLRESELPAQTHGAWQVALPDDKGGGKWVDNGGVILNHKLHLAAEGVLDADGNKVQLTCAVCHTPETDGRTMKPVVYEQHCASCHPLRLVDRFARLGDLPHEAPELVRGVIRERLVAIATENKPADIPTPIRRLPQPAIVSDSQSEKIETLLVAADHAIFGLEAKGYCRKCHHLQIRDGQWHVPLLNPEFGVAEENSTREMMPSRWFAHGEFNHQKHLTVACADCHDAAASTQTSDILLPGIADCRKCHGTNPSRIGPPAIGPTTIGPTTIGTTTTARGAAADCVLCHDYHGPSKPLRQNAETEKLLTFFNDMNFNNTEPQR
jgi:ribosomal protein L40E